MNLNQFVGRSGGMEPIQTQHPPCLQKNAPFLSSPTPTLSLSLSSQIAPAFSIPRLNSEQIAIISRYILSSLFLVRNLLLFLRRRRRRRIVVRVRRSSFPSHKTLAKYCALRGPPRSSIYLQLTTTGMTVERASSIFEGGREGERRKKA